MVKKCSKCKELKSLKEFFKDSTRRDKYAYVCRACYKETCQANKQKEVKRRREYYRNNKERVLNSKRQYYEKNKERMLVRVGKYYKNNKKEIIKRVKRYYKNNKEKLLLADREYYKKNKQKIAETNKKHRNSHKQKIRKAHCKYDIAKYKIDPRFNLNRRMGAAIRGSLKGNKNGQKWETLVGYNIEILKKHLRDTMPQGHTWQDYLNGKLQIDHIIPITAFNFSNPEHIDFKRCWALKNLRLLPAEENLRKWMHLEKSFQPSLALKEKA